MGPTIMMMLIFAGVAVYCFFKFVPYHDKPEQVNAFNWMVIAVNAMLATSWYFAITFDLMGKSAQKYTPLLAIGGACVITVVFLLIFFLVRNFWVFKPKNPTWRP